MHLYVCTDQKFPLEELSKTKKKNDGIASLWEKMVASFHCNMSKVHILASAPLFFFASRYSPFLVHTYTYTYSYYTFNLSRKTLLISKYRVARKLPTSSPYRPAYPSTLRVYVVLADIRSDSCDLSFLH